MITFSLRGILLDIEGTTSSVRYVYDVLFPYARRGLRAFVQKNWERPDVARTREMIIPPPPAPLPRGERGEEIERLCAEVERLMDADSKTSGLKELQGLIWQEGYAAGLLRSHVFPDLPPALAAWAKAGIDVRIFSSGSAAAQRVFFKYTEAGDLTPFLRGHYDTTVGAKRAPQSYTTIAAGMALPPSAILFLSDVVEELDAANAAGMQTALVMRPGNAPPRSGQPHSVLKDFNEIKVDSHPK